MCLSPSSGGFGHHRSLPFEPDLRRILAVGKHDLVEKAVRKHGGNEISGPPDEIAGGNVERKFRRDGNRKRVARRRKDDAAAAEDPKDVDSAPAREIMDRLVSK